SLLGIVDLDQVRAFHPEPGSLEARQFRIFDPKELIEPRVERALALAREVSEVDVRTLRDSDRKRALQRRLEDEVAPLAAVADALSGAMVASAGSLSTLDGRLRALGERVRVTLAPGADVDALCTAAQPLLDVDLPEREASRRPLHWALAYPEVFVRESGGFDVIVGNPPFLGGQKITGTVGTAFREYVVHWIAGGTRGSADLVAYFFLRSASLLRRTGTLGLLATNTIAQGDTRDVGLEQLIGSGLTVHRAVKSRPWPGSESLEVSQVWATLASWKPEPVLDGHPVRGISTALTPKGRVDGPPFVLDVNAGKSFQGSIVLGMGFTLTPEEAKVLLDRDPRNAEVLFPYLGGSDLNDSPSQSAERFVINFFDWDEERARTYPDCYALVEARVKPERQRRKPSGEYQLRRPLPEKWWIYGEKRPALYSAIRSLSRVLAVTLHSKSVLFVFVPTRHVFSHGIGVFAYDDDFHFGVLSSTLHWWWAQARSSTLETRTRYTLTDCFETFPQPPYTEAVEHAGRALDEHRRQLMIDANEGLTKTY